MASSLLGRCIGVVGDAASLAFSALAPVPHYTADRLLLAYGAVPAPTSSTLTGFSLKSSEGMTRAAVCGPTTLGKNLIFTVHV